MLVDSSGTRTQHSYEHHSESFAAYRLFHVFPRLLGAGYMFSHAYLAPVTRFPTLCAGFTYSHAYLALVTRFPTPCAGYMFSRAYLALVTCFPMLTWRWLHVFPCLLGAGYMFSHALRRLHVFPRLLGICYMFFHALCWLHFFPRFLDTGYMFSHACLALFTCLPMNIENYFFYCDTVKLSESKLTLTLLPNPA